MTRYRVLVTGSREWEDRRTIARTLSRIHREHGPSTLVCGRTYGAERMAVQIAHRLGWVVDAYPTDNNTHTEECPDWHRESPRCDLARARRDRSMISSGVDECVAFDLGDSQAVNYLVARAAEENVPVTTISVQWRG